jgi:hypothetical protein
MCINNTFSSFLMQRTDGKHDFIVLSSLETVQYWDCIFSLLYRLLRIWLKRQKYLNFIRTKERESTPKMCNVLCTVHFVVTVFNVGNVLMCVIYQLDLAVFMYVTRISRCI